MPLVLDFDWRTVGKTLLGASMGSALVQGIFSLVAERRKRRGQATYLAMRLAVLLDAYGQACSDMIDRNRSAEIPPDREFPDWETVPD
jgi:hypothetical protein